MLKFLLGLRVAVGHMADNAEVATYITFSSGCADVSLKAISDDSHGAGDSFFLGRLLIICTICDALELRFWRGRVSIKGAL